MSWIKDVLFFDLFPVTSISVVFFHGFHGKGKNVKAWFSTECKMSEKWLKNGLI